jgi:NO-binding membrane sensor protein with MHYT domain
MATDRVPRRQFTLVDLFIACVVVAVFFGVFTLLPLKMEHDDYRGPPSLAFALWFACVLWQLRKGNLWQRRWVVGTLFAGPLIGLVQIALMHYSPEDELDWSGYFIVVSCWFFASVVLSIIASMASGLPEQRNAEHRESPPSASV